jgi:hypothetical protein
MDKEIILYHKDWYGICKITKNKIKRLTDENETGILNFKKNQIEVNWDKWNTNYFNYIQDNIYIEKTYIFEKLLLILLLKINNYFILPYHKDDYYFIYGNIEDYNLEKYIYYNNQKYIFYLNKIYIYENDIHYYFHLETYNFNKKTTYILNKNNLKFFDIDNIFNCGCYEMNNNILYLKWQNGNTKKYLSNIYHEEKNMNYENIKIIKNNKIVLYDRILFSNISLVENKIIFSSIHYIYHPWNFDELKIKIPNNKIIQKYNLDYENYESCFMMIIELENIQEKESIIIEYENNIYEIDIYQLQLPKKEIYAMTLFKDDYYLIKKYMEYYHELGIDCFLFYYNGTFNDKLLKEINMLNQSKYQIILIEWDLEYWWQYLSNPRHHHAQSMAINDSLYILKDVCDYILFNDLDEYIVLENNFKSLIENNIDVDIFEFKCMFCQMGNELIKYRNFYFEFDEKNIIKGNYWDKYREKNLIKTSSINLMGIHYAIQKFSKKEFVIHNSGYFYHFVNFFEKNRPELMTQYIS